MFRDFPKVFFLSCVVDNFQTLPEYPFLRAPSITMPLIHASGLLYGRQFRESIDAIISFLTFLIPITLLQVLLQRPFPSVWPQLSQSFCSTISSLFDSVLFTFLQIHEKVDRHCWLASQLAVIGHIMEVEKVFIGKEVYYLVRIFHMECAVFVFLVRVLLM